MPVEIITHTILGCFFFVFMVECTQKTLLQSLRPLHDYVGAMVEAKESEHDYPRAMK